MLTHNIFYCIIGLHLLFTNYLLNVCQCQSFDKHEWMVDPMELGSTGSIAPSGPDSGDEKRNSLYTYDNINEEIRRTTEEFLNEFARMRNLLERVVWPESGNEMDPVRRRRSIDNDQNDFIPDFIRDGILLISKIVPFEPKLCSDRGFIVDFFPIKFNKQQYFLCLVKNSQRVYELIYGSININFGHSLRLVLKQPKKILAFVKHDTSSGPKLIVILLSEKWSVDEPAIKWLSIDVDNKIYQNRIDNLNRISTKNLGFWPVPQILIVHDLYEEELKIYKFAETYFDPIEFVLPVQHDLNALCSFTLNGISYLVLGYRTVDDSHQKPKDLTVLKYNNHLERLERLQTIQSVEDVTEIKYFSIGYGISQENFLAIVEKSNIVLYKFLKSKREFMIFQRIRAIDVRGLSVYGDSRRLFVMAVILQSNDIFFITYNSLQFIYSNVNLQIYAIAWQPIFLYRIPALSNGNENDLSVQLMIGSVNGFRGYSIEFYLDNNLFKLWTQHLDWCRIRRSELSQLEAQTTQISHRFSESYLHNDPLVIRGTLHIPRFKGVVETRDYRQATLDQPLILNQDYFKNVYTMKRRLDHVDRIIHQSHGRLANALAIDSDRIQVVQGGGQFKNLRLIEYGGNPIDPNSKQEATLFSAVNILTDQLNGHSVRNLIGEVINIHDSEVRILNPMNFQMIESQALSLGGLVNGQFNFSELISSSGGHHIFGRKRLHQSLLIENQIKTKTINGKTFGKDSVLLSVGDQIINDPIVAGNQKLRAHRLSAKHVNTIDIDALFSSMVRKNQPLTLSIPLTIDHLVVQDFSLEGQLNNENIGKLMDEVFWLDQTNQTLTGDFRFTSNLTVHGNLEVNRLNNKNLVEDFVVVGRTKTVKASKFFADLVQVNNLEVSQTLNGLMVIDGVPDLVINKLPQTITGKKTLLNLSLKNNSNLGGFLNGLNITKMDEQSRLRPQTKYFETMRVKNVANFEAGVRFMNLNSINEKQFSHLITDSLTLNDNWSDLSFDHVQFEELRVGNLDCNLINGTNLANDLLTKTTSQTIDSSYKFTDISFGGTSHIDFLNNIDLNTWNDVMLTTGNQTINGTKVIVGNVEVESLFADFINTIPIKDIVFGDQLINQTRPITGLKLFKGPVHIEALKVKQSNLKSINQIDVGSLFVNTLRRTSAQSIPQHIRFNTLLLPEGINFDSLSINRMNLKTLGDDIVLRFSRNHWQNITGPKVFLADVQFRDLEYTHLLDGITVYEMKSNWMVNGRYQTVRGNFSINQLTVNNVFIHDGSMNEVNLDSLTNNIVWLNRKTSIFNEIVFSRQVTIQGNILLNGRINQVDFRTDVVHSNNFNGIQTIRGRIDFLNNVTIENELEINGQINRVNVRRLCDRVYWPNPADRSIVINGDVRLVGPAKFDSINGLSYPELRSDTLKHNQNGQHIMKPKLVETLVLNAPTLVNGRINNIDIRSLFENYMSVSRNQDVKIDLEVANVQFEGDFLVRKLFQSQVSVVGSVNMTRLHDDSLRLIGDQTFNGDILFEDNITIDSHIYAQHINDIANVESVWMRKQMTRQTFENEILFTQDLRVTKNAGIVRGRRVSDVQIDRLYSDAVLDRSDLNYTVYGAKTFDRVDVQILHTNPLNNVVVSRENLLLKNYEQNVGGETRLVGNVQVNANLVVQRINQIDLEDFYRRIAKKSNPTNVIESKVRIRNLMVNDVQANGMIDQVNISVLNQFTETTQTLKRLEQSLTKTQQQYSVLERNLKFTTSKLLYYDLFDTVSSSDFNTSLKPLLLAQLGFDLCILAQTSIPSHHRFGIEEMCGQIKLYCRQSHATTRWNHAYTLHFPGTLLTIKQIRHGFFMLITDIFGLNPKQISQCLFKSNQTYQVDEASIMAGSLWFQNVHFFAQTRTVVMSSNTFRFNTNADIDLLQNEKLKARLVDDHQNGQNLYAVIASPNTWNVIRIQINPKDFRISLDLYSTQPLYSNRIRLLYATAHTFLISVRDSKLEAPKLKIYRIGSRNNNQTTNDRQRPLMTEVEVLNLDSKIAVIVELINEELLVVFDEISRSVLVYRTQDGVVYSKIQEICIHPVIDIHVVYNHLKTTINLSMNSFWPSPVLVVQQIDSISVYQLIAEPSVKFRLLTTIQPLAQQIGSLLFSGHFMGLFFGEPCDLGDGFVDILTPHYRQPVPYGQESTHQKRTQEVYFNFTQFIT